MNSFCIICSTPKTINLSEKLEDQLALYYFLTEFMGHPLLTTTQISQSLKKQPLSETLHFCAKDFALVQKSKGIFAQIHALKKELEELRGEINVHFHGEFDGILSVVRTKLGGKIVQENYEEIEIVEEKLSENFKEKKIVEKLRKDFKCKVCGMTFSRMDYFKVHCQCHSDYPEEVFEIPKEKQIRHGNVKSKIHKNVKRKSNKFQCPVCSEWLPYMDLRRHVLGHEKLFACNCGATFFSEELLQVHGALSGCFVAVETKTICPNCLKNFPTFQTLRQHFLLHHSRNFVCEICAKIFIREDSLKKHLNFHAQGNDGKIFKCDFESCTKAFRRKRDLGVHQRLHSGVKDFLCNLCGISFRHEWSFRRHNILRHQAPSRIWSCSACGKTFKIKWHLDQHLKSKSHGGSGLGKRVRVKKLSF